MRAENKAEFAMVVEQTSELLQQPMLSKDGIEMFFALLADFSIEQVKHGFRQHLRHSKSGMFMPKPAEIIARIVGEPEVKADEAWAKVDKAVRSVGAYRSVVFDDPIIHAVISDMGGWISLCQLSENDYKFRAKDFVRIYKGYSVRSLGEYPRLLAGIEERENAAGGFESKAPLMLGNRQTCLEVFKAGTNKPMLQRHQTANMAELMQEVKLLEVAS